MIAGNRVAAARLAGGAAEGDARTMGGDTFPGGGGGGGHAPHEGLSMKYVCKILGILDHRPLPHFQYCLSAKSADFLTPFPLAADVLDGWLPEREVRRAPQTCCMRGRGREFQYLHPPPPPECTVIRIENPVAINRQGWKAKRALRALHWCAIPLLLNLMSDILHCRVG